MEAEVHKMSDLFDQLGLPSDQDSIEAFISQHQTETNNKAIDELDIWNASQAEFLKQARAEDAGWAEIVDELSARLSSH
ncbi:MAG: DUF2789 family protein [Ketobacteraceae bacterium]|nr:DUF2789 family protein [Ketobacteraceae bacterium]